MTWRRYLLESRLLQAMAMLTEPGRSVAEVAVDVGFDSVSAFTRAFTRFAGETPTALPQADPVRLRPIATQATGRARR